MERVMNKRTWLTLLPLLGVFLLGTLPIAGQPEPKKEPEKKEPDKKGFPFGPGGPGGFVFGGPAGQRRQLVEQVDKDGDGRLNKEERQATREFLKKERAGGGPGGFGPGGKGKGPGGFGPGGFGPGMFMAKPLLEELDTDKDGKLSKAEFVAGVKMFFAECDKGKKRFLDWKERAERDNADLPKTKG